MFLDEAALEMRITKDIDIIIIVETLTKEFGKRFWEFIRDGQYDLYKSKDEKLRYYRFINNNTNEYPKMIELFSKKQGFIHEVDSLFTPIIIDDEISSLSAIILNDDYYKFLLLGKTIIKNISVLDPIHLIAFKARAHIDLTNKKNEGFFVNERDSKKHKNDIYRLLQLIKISDRIDAPSVIKKDIFDFIQMINDDNENIERLTKKVLNLNKVINLLKRVFGL